MADRFKTLHAEMLPPSTLLTRFEEQVHGTLTTDSPALEAMTDLTRVRAMRVTPTLCIDDAVQRMVHAGVRSLFVTDADDELLGLVTARDINSEKPLAYAASSHTRHCDIRVEHIMTPRQHLQAMSLHDVAAARVGDIVVTLREQGRQHGLVVQRSRESRPRLRGVFSITHIGRLLGVKIDPTGPVQSFAALHSALT